MRSLSLAVLAAAVSGGNIAAASCPSQPLSGLSITSAIGASASSLHAGYMLYSVGATQAATCTVEGARLVQSMADGLAVQHESTLPDSTYTLMPGGPALLLNTHTAAVQARLSQGGGYEHQLIVDNIACSQPGVQVCVRAHLAGTDHTPSEQCIVASYNGACSAALPDYAHYVGCYADGSASQRQLPTRLALHQTAGSCVQLAHNAGYPYAGLQQNGQCWAGDAVPALGTSTQCITPCVDGSNCGGYYALGTYSIDPSPITASSDLAGSSTEPLPRFTEYAGCYIDEAAPFRQLPSQLAGTHNVTSCLLQAQRSGYAYAGLSWHGECWAGRKQPELGLAANCNTLCADGSNCGGELALSTYTLFHK